MIRHRLAGAAFALALILGAPAGAQVPAQQNDIPQSHLSAARDVLISSGIASSFDSIYAEFRERVSQLVLSTRPELQKDVNEVIATLKPEAELKRDEMVASASFLFAKHMSEEDLKQVNAFFTSPVGQRYNAARTKALDEIFALLQPWSINTSNFLFDRFSEEMRKRGHQL